MRLAVLSDIHGNDIALEAVLAHAKSRGYDRLVDLGDTVSGPLRPLETYQRMASIDALAIAGNHERQLTTLPVEDMNASDAFTFERIGPERIAGLRRRSAQARIEDVLLVHGSPTSDLDYLLEDVSGGRPALKPAEEVAAAVGNAADGATLILCGHSHIQRTLQLPDGPLVVNAGSVGLPAWGDASSPRPFRMENGSPHARYAIVERGSSGWSVDFHLVVYDWASAADDARAAGRADWAHALATGFVQTTR